MTMINLTPKQYAQLLFWPIAVASLFVLSLPTIGLQMLIAAGHVPFLFGWFASIPTLSAGWLVYMVLIRHLQKWAATKAVMRRGRQLQARGMYNLGEHIIATAHERSEWKMLASMAVLFGLHVLLVKPGAQAQMRDIERPEPRVADTTTEHLRVVLCLQRELHLNKHGVNRALKYLRQGYGEQYVRNLFAPVVRKS